MKAALIGGEFHGQVITIPRLEVVIYLPAFHRTASIDEQPYDPCAESAKYSLEVRHLLATDRQVEVAIYTHHLTSISNYTDTMLRVTALHQVCRILGPVVGLNRWLDAELETRLSYDADLQRHLAASRGPYFA